MCRPSRGQKDISYHLGRAWSFRGDVSKWQHVGVGDEAKLHGTCGKDTTTLPWWWLGMKTFLLNGEQQSSWERG